MLRPVYWFPGLLQVREPYVSRHQPSGVVGASRDDEVESPRPGRLSRRKEEAMSACAEESLSVPSGVAPANEESEGIEETGDGDDEELDAFCQRVVVVSVRADGRRVRDTAAKSVRGVMKDMLVTEGNE